MLNKKNRIGNRKVIDRLFRKGKLFKNHFFIFKYEQAVNGPSQFAVSVSKKIYKKAVKRNYLRRQIQESLRLNLPSLKQNFIALIIVRSAVADQKTTFQEIKESINTFFKTITSNEE